MSSLIRADRRNARERCLLLTGSFMSCEAEEFWWSRCCTVSSSSLSCAANRNCRRLAQTRASMAEGDGMSYILGEKRGGARDLPARLDNLWKVEKSAAA